MACYFFFFRRFWAKEPRRSEPIFANKKVDLYRRTRVHPQFLSYSVDCMLGYDTGIMTVEYSRGFE